MIKDEKPYLDKSPVVANLFKQVYPFCITGYQSVNAKNFHEIERIIVKVVTKNSLLRF